MHRPHPCAGTSVTLAARTGLLHTVGPARIDAMKKDLTVKGGALGTIWIRDRPFVGRVNAEGEAAGCGVGDRL